MWQRVAGLCFAGLIMVISQVASASSGWESYKQRFLMPDGRIVDTGNKSISHTEGQGFGMLLAVAENDQASFDKMWNWTSKNLHNADNGLYYWRFNPTEADPITDKNNASDGDTLIAWALLKAGEKWHNTNYLQASSAIQSALIKNTVIEFAGYQVMLPGAEGFNRNSYVNLNPSYFIFPAWADFASRSHLKVWRDLINDGQRLLSKMSWGEAHLPTDWVSLYADGHVAPSMQWPPRFSYDAIRIPLYLHWYNPQSPQLQPFKNYWQRYGRTQTPAWVNVVTNEKASYMMNGGLLAIRDLTMGNNSSVTATIAGQDDYYSASLRLLSWLSLQ